MEPNPADSLPPRGKQPLFFKGIRFWGYKLVIFCSVKKSPTDRMQLWKIGDVLILSADLLFNVIKSFQISVFQYFLHKKERNVDTLLYKILRDKTYLFSSLLQVLEYKKLENSNYLKWIFYCKVFLFEWWVY